MEHDLKFVKNDIIRVVNYLFVGGSSALLELLLFQLFYAVLSLQIAAANLSAVFIATAYNFLLNRSWAFKQDKSAARSILLYLLLFAFNTTFSTTAICLLVAHNVSSVIAKIFTQVCIVLWNYVLYRKVIFT